MSGHPQAVPSAVLRVLKAPLAWHWRMPRERSFGMAELALRALKNKVVLLPIERTFMHFPIPSGIGCEVAFAYRQASPRPVFRYRFLVLPLGVPLL